MSRILRCFIDGNDGKLCARAKCAVAKTCQYPHNCKALTMAEYMAEEARRFEAQRCDAEANAELEKHRQQASAERRDKITAMLAPHGLDLEDLVAFIRETLV